MTALVALCGEDTCAGPDPTYLYWTRRLARISFQRAILRACV
ncbi:hypothetical protein FHR70_001658 [Microvirga lupini]|uniref:Uncharacterized protein n=1 Tax=Microvirga lupini TaxID=420324 RepID=A0A7W4YWW6_9HYPH|nr:hypothetical protein [Microvirga lupini]